MTTTTEPGRPKTDVSLDPGWNNQDIWLNLRICRGETEVEVGPTVDLPQAVVQAMGNILSGSPALQNVQLHPGFNVKVYRDKNFTVVAEPYVTADERGVHGGGLRVNVGTKKVTVGVGGEYDTRTHGITGNVSVSQGSTPEVHCFDRPKQKLTFACTQINHIEGHPAVDPLYLPVTETRYMFFKYAKAELNPQVKISQVNTVPDIPTLHSLGFQIKTIEGFTSPEGPRGREHEPLFEGNIALAERRAQVAKNLLLIACPDCTELKDLNPAGKSELPPKLGAEEPEPKGPKMEQRAVKEFLGTDDEKSTPDPLAPHDPESLAAFQKLPEREQRNQAFDLMRRATITLEKEKGVQLRRGQSEVKEHDEPNKLTDCPQDVASKANESFGFTPFNLNIQKK